MEFIKLLKKTWHFIWEDNSIWSWLVNIVLAFVLIKYLVYPGLGLLFGTSFPIVAVVSTSMEHDSNFNGWWESQKELYANFNITKEEFAGFNFKNGFNKGDIMILIGKKPEKLAVGDILVYKAGKPDPIIHRIVAKKNDNGFYVFQTKGDHNLDQIKSYWLDETAVPESAAVGKAVLRIPLLGWVKILFVQLLGLIP